MTSDVVASAGATATTGGAPVAQPRSKDASKVQCASEHRTYDALFDALIRTPEPSPVDHGTVSLLVGRPDLRERTIVSAAEFTVEGGMEGSGWEELPGRGKIDQICVMSSAAIRAVTGGDDRDAWAAAGDQVFMDLDLSKDNFADGDRVVVGRTDAAAADGVVLEVTEKLHKGCAKFAKRYGADALKVMNCPEGRQLRFRGIYFRVVTSGTIREGDSIEKVGAEFGDPAPDEDAVTAPSS